jgi:signal transduction histidine kinase
MSTTAPLPNAKPKAPPGATAEHPVAGQLQADVLETTNRTLLASLSRLATSQSPRAAIIEITAAMAEALSPLGVIALGVVLLQRSGRHLRLEIFARDGQEFDLTGTSLDRDWPIDDPTMVIPWTRAQRESFIWGLTSDESVLVPEAREFHELLGAKSVAYHSLRRGEATIGFVGLDLRSEQRPSESQVELIQLLALHVALAVELERVARVDRDAVLVAERQAAAERGAAELAEINTRLRASLAELREKNDQLRERERLLRCAAEVTDVLLQADDLASGVDAALRNVGVSGNLSRAGFLRYHAEHAQYVVANEWCATGIADHATLGLTVFPSAAGGQWHTDLHAGRSVWALIDDVPASLRSSFDRLGILSTGCVPIFLQSQFAGMIAFDDCVRRRQWTRAEIDTLTAAANSIGAALQRSLTADRMAAERLHVAEERHALAAQKALEAERSSRALQDMVDAIAGAEDYDEFIRAALIIFQRHVGEHECGFWEYAAAERPVVRLTAWLQDGKMVDPSGVRIPDGEHRATLHQLVTGFTVPDAHLGLSYAHRHRSSVLDHTTASAVPAFHRFALAQGWELELNVPLVAGGRVIAAITVYRRHPNRFLPSEIDLAEALARQLAFGLEARRLAELARQTEIELATMRAREEAAANLVSELQSTNDVLRRCTDRFAKATTIDELLEVFLVEATAVAGGNSGAIADRVNGTEFTLRALVQGSVIARPQADHSADERFRRVTSEDSLGFLGRVVANEVVDVCVDEAFAAWFPESAAYHRRNGEVVIWHFPFGCRGTVSGFFGLAFKTYPGLTAERRQTVEALATLASLTLEMIRLAEASKFATLAAERQASAQRRAAEFAAVNASLRLGLAALTEAESFRDGVAKLFEEICRSASAAYGMLFSYDGASNTLGTNYWYDRGRLSTGFDSQAAPILRTRFSADVTPWFRASLGSAEVLIADFDALSPDLEAHMWPGVIDWHRAEGRRYACAIPLIGSDGPLGVLGLAWSEPHSLSEEGRELLQTLGSTAAFAWQLSTIADSRAGLLLAKERRELAEQKAREAENSSRALQATVDALQDIEDVEQIVPRVLDIVARTFGAEDCAVFDNDATGFVRLMYWHSAGRTMTPSQLRQSNLWDSETSDLVQLLADGFTVPDSYLGVAAQSAIGIFVLNHREGTSVPEFDRFAVKNGWDLELNVGVGSQGVRRGTLCIYRPVARPYTVAEQSLAASLAKQMALAIGMARLAAEARQAALAVERQQAPEQRTADAANANLMLRRANARLAADPDLGAFVGHVMRELCEFFGAKAAVIFEHEPQRENLRVIAAYSDGQVISGIPDRPWLEAGGRMRCDTEHWRTLYSTQSALSVELPGTTAQAPNPLLEWMQEEKLVEMRTYPLLAGDTVVGFLGFGFTEKTPFDSVQLELANFLAQQISIALRLSRLSEIARQASLLDERNRIARDLHDTMAQSFTGIYMQLQAATRYSETNQLLARACIERAQTLARDGLREARQSVLALTARGKTMDVVAALTSIAQVTAAGTTCPCTVQGEGEARAIDSLIGGNILAICREAISNAQRYARASQITLTVFYRPAEVEVHIQDNGDGFSPSEVNQSGFGLTGMQARAERIGGQLTIMSAPGTGTTVAVRVRTDRPVPGGTDTR